MNETNFDWDDLNLFVAVARARGLAGAKAATGKSAPTLGRRMVALERRLGRELFHRMARGYALTPEGQALFERVTEIEAQIVPLVDTATPDGPLIKISAGTWVTEILCRQMAEVIGSSGARLRFISAEEVLSIAHRETLIGVRNHRPEDTALAGRRIGTVRFAVYAVAPDLGTWVRVMGETPSSRWVAAHVGDAAVIEVTHPRNVLDLALAGCGRAVLPTFVGDRAAGLVRVSPELEALEHDQWLVMHHDDRHIPAVRSLISRLVTVLKENCAVH